MSGILGIVRPGGGPVDQALVRALTRFLAFRGPDARDVWCGGSIGLGHAMLRTTEEAGRERLPMGLDGQFWITSDARLDERAELFAQLVEAGRKLARNSPDSEMILHAYAAWGESCVERLRGDFAFGIWDARRKSLFCARDHLGIKPFYFADCQDFVLFSNTLDCVRMHPGVPDELNEAAIADFLLFGLNCDAATTTFRAIRRLPPAHFLRVSAEGLRIGRYWSLPVDGRIRYSRADDYVEQFQILLRNAVGDRLRGGRVGVLLSGGLDSSAVAATARELSPERGDSGRLRAYTVTYEKQAADRDGKYAREVAEFLGIPIRCLPVDHLQLFERWDSPAFRWPEPVDDPLMAGLFDQFGAVAAECRVALDGEGADNLMHFQMWPYAKSLARNREWRRLFAEVPRYLRVRRFPWRGIRQRAGLLAGQAMGLAAMPKWLSPDFAKRVDAKSRWRDGVVARSSSAHPVMPAAHASMSLPHWTRLFELQNPGVTRCAVEVRYPFLDLRIINYMLALPPFPWAFRKTLLREAMAGRLPEEIRLRPKTPLPFDPVLAALRMERRPVTERVPWDAETECYVRRAKYQEPGAEQGPAAAEMWVRPLCLNFWLRHSKRIQYQLMAEVRNG
ncbi:MAG: asparagine synthetase B family protein [Candidatus Acidiferrales bacterium]